jgi:CBS-domain-containing membrane protein
MVARDVMTADVVTVTAETAVPEIAALLLKHRISAAPVMDARGGVPGIVSEGDLMHRPEAGTERKRRSWWLTLFGDQGDLAKEFVPSRSTGSSGAAPAPRACAGVTTSVGRYRWAGSVSAVTAGWRSTS